MKEVNLPEPEFHTDGIFKVTFKRKYSVICDTENDSVNDTELFIFEEWENTEDLTIHKAWLHEVSTYQLSNYNGAFGNVKGNCLMIY